MLSIPTYVFEDDQLTDLRDKVQSMIEDADPDDDVRQLEHLSIELTYACHSRGVALD